MCKKPQESKGKQKQHQVFLGDIGMGNKTDTEREQLLFPQSMPGN